MKCGDERMLLYGMKHGERKHHGKATSLPLPRRNSDLWTFQPYPRVARNICDVAEALAIEVETPALTHFTFYS